MSAGTPVNEAVAEDDGSVVDLLGAAKAAQATVSAVVGIGPPSSFAMRSWTRKPG
jgi:hypothetical protein